MGNQLFDQYTYLHFATGIIAYFWNISLIHWLIIHFLFELAENSQIGMKFINNCLTFWPGGKPQSDTVINIVGDNIGAVLGWITAFLLDSLGTKWGWYPKHLSYNK